MESETPDSAAPHPGYGLQRRLRITGIVQGVGFRPYVWHLANELNLAGWVRNDAAGVEVLVEGEPEPIEAFTRRLPLEIPPLAQVRDMTWRDGPATGEHTDFTITESGAGRAATLIGPDTATCPDCLAELFDPADRRWRYAFINCTHCGPRYTLTRGLPYDRAQTSMAAFPLCPDCAGEYRNPADRRFHAEPTACPVCGPGVWVVDLSKIPPSPPLRKGGEPRPSAEGFLPFVKGGQEGFGYGQQNKHDPISDTLHRLQAGQILAIKGLGGFHLACDARNADAVQTLRERKNREEKPFAVMAANLASLAEWVELSPAEAELLRSPERPIVLLRKKPGADAPFSGIAPGLAWLGVMLPYTPLHWLIFHEAAGRPAGTEWMGQPQELMLVMTSANPGGEPLVIRNDEAVERLAGIADGVLMHDRDIVVRCDDSVVLLAPSPSRGEGGGGGETLSGSAIPLPPTPALPREGGGSVGFIRRARGYTPRAIRLARVGPPVLALGGYLKNTICVTRGDEAFVSQHIGGLDNPATCAMLMEVAQHLLDILEVKPEAVAHDLHPDFFASRHALELAEQWGVPAIAVQHHHAHIAAVAAEHGVTAPIMGLALDGVGLGSDGQAWGGELLRMDGASFTRLGHLSPLALPGGDKAAKEPWRMAAAALFKLGRSDEIPRRFPGQPLARQLHVMLEHDVHCPPTTSLGRWFDAAAGLLGAREVMAYEGQAAMLLEGLAERGGEVAPLADGWRLSEVVIPAQAGIQSNPDWTPASAGVTMQLDLLPLLARLADETDPARGAALFHATLALALAEWTERAARREGLTTVALGGGCFLNHILSRNLGRLLIERGLTVLEARQAPPNDGGLSLGQAWVAMQHIS
ncbi:MAG: carbamoyltransferase HypF [Betaproteobacteria bacterium]|nr:carbamoyltransferase HypF [Betaproteobacteria bacterium]